MKINLVSFTNANSSTYRRSVIRLYFIWWKGCLYRKLTSFIIQVNIIDFISNIKLASDFKLIFLRQGDSAVGLQFQSMRMSLVNWFQVKPHKSLTSAQIIWFWKDLRRALVIRWQGSGVSSPGASVLPHLFQKSPKWLTGRIRSLEFGAFCPSKNGQRVLPITCRDHCLSSPRRRTLVFLFPPTSKKSSAQLSLKFGTITHSFRIKKLGWFYPIPYQDHFLTSPEGSVSLLFQSTPK